MNDMEQKKYRYICVDGSGQCRVPLPYAYPADVPVPEMLDVGSRLLYEAFPRVKYHKEYSQFRIEIEELPSEKSPVSPEEDGLQFLQELRAAQKPLREAPANNAELDKAVDAIKDALRKYVADPMNCLSNTCGLELEDSLEVGKVAVYMGSDREHPLSALDMRQLELLYHRLSSMGLAVSASLGRGGHIKLHW